MIIVENRSKIESVVILGELVLIVIIRKFLFASIQTSGVWEWVLFTLCFLAVLPMITIKYIFKKSLRDYGISFSFNKEQKYTLITLLVVMLAAVLLVVLKLNWADIIPVFFWVSGGIWVTLFIDVCLLSLIVIATEIFFRGYLLTSLSNAWNGTAAILLTTALAAGYSYMSTEVNTLSKGVYLITINLFLSILAYVNKSMALSAIVSWIFLFSIDLLAIYTISQA